MRVAWRQLWSSPAVSVASIAMLTVAIAAILGALSIVYPLALAKLPVKDPQQLFFISSVGTVHDSDISAASDLSIYSAASTTLQGIFGFAEPKLVDLIVAGNHHPAVCQPVSDAFFSVLDVKPWLGNYVSPHKSIVLDYWFWRVALAGMPQVGSSAVVDGRTFQIAAIAPPSFYGVIPEQRPDCYMPLGTDAWITLVGRLRPGLSAREAWTRLQPYFFTARRASLLPSAEKDEVMQRLVLTSAARGISQLAPQVARKLWVVVAIAALLFLTALLNVGGLLLAQAWERSPASAVRAALGSGPYRLAAIPIRQAVWIGLMSLTGGLLIFPAVRGLAALIIPTGATLKAVPLPVVAITMLSIAAATLVVTSSPAAIFYAVEALRPRNLGSLDARTLPRLLGADWLVVAQVAGGTAALLTCALLAHLFASTLSSARVGNAPGRVLAVDLAACPPGALIPFLRRISALPGVRQAAAARLGPLSGREIGVNIGAEGPSYQSGDENHVFLDRITPGYFATLGVPLRTGRTLTGSDGNLVPTPVIINSALAREFFGSGSPLRRRLKFTEGGMEVQVAGVVPNLSYSEPAAPPPVIYLPSLAGGQITVFVRLSAPELSGTILKPIDDIAVTFGIRIKSLETIRSRLWRLLRPALTAAALGVFLAMLAMAVAALGLAAVLRLALSRRQREFAIRLALGAPPRHVRWMLHATALRIAAVGMGVGVVAAWTSWRALSSVVPGVPRIDLGIGAWVVAAVILVVLLASHPAARHAANADVVTLLRQI